MWSMMIKNKNHKIGINNEKMAETATFGHHSNPSFFWINTELSVIDDVLYAGFVLCALFDQG